LALLLVDGFGTTVDTFAEAFIHVPAGRFMRGSDDSDPDARENEKPPHEVVLMLSVFIAAAPVTQRLYEALMGKNPSRFTGADLPVECVSWFDAVRFCNALSLAQQLPEAYVLSGDYAGNTPTVAWSGPAAPGWRLPTEAEWEYAARAGTTGPRYGALDEIAWYKDNSGNGTHPVGLKLPNPWGLYDTLGNVWEWCWDWDAPYSTGKRVDPVGPSGGDNRVYRGGSWLNGARYARAADRSKCGPASRYGFVGFRPSRSVVP